MNATRLYTVKHGGYKQVLSIEGANPNIGNGRGPIQRDQEFKPQPYWELQTVYRDTLFSYEEGLFEKEDGEILANKVKESEFEIVSVEKRTAMSLHQNYSI
jgi:DNA topoisomerase-3